MGERTLIPWADHTFNPWIGYQRVSPGCDHCYAAAWDGRWTSTPSRWGPHAARGRTAPANWRQPLRWNDRARLEKRRPRVFCGSLCDVFDNRVPPEWRAGLFTLIAATPHLDWLLLTKRPGNIPRMLPASWGAGWPNVWLGATVVNQKEADRDVPKLLGVPARRHFLSMEPLLGPVRLRMDWFGVRGNDCPVSDPDCLAADGECHDACERPAGLGWIIVGGESGHHARPLDVRWVRMVTQGLTGRAPVFVKQLGRFAIMGRHDAVQPCALGAGWDALEPGGPLGRVTFRDPAGADPIEWPADLRRQEVPSVIAPEDQP